jgi:hypothetical protein
MTGNIATTWSAGKKAEGLFNHLTAILPSALLFTAIY